MEVASTIAITSPHLLLFPSSSPRPAHLHFPLLLYHHHPKPSSSSSSPSIRRIISSKTLTHHPPSAVSAAAREAELDKAPRRLDRTGRFCTSRSARELSLVIAYAACLEGVDPIRLFDKRVNAKRLPGYDFDKALLVDYDHMSFGGAPVDAGTEEEAEELMRKNEEESAKEAEVLSAPPKLVYSKFVLRMARDILKAVVQRWNNHVQIIEKIVPPHWKDEPAARILELCILHQAMAEIAEMGTRHQIVISEAVDLAKRFCDGCAPRIINGCLRTFVKDHMSNQQVEA